MEGALSKWTNVMKGWQIRWFVLDETAGIFSYYTSKDKMLRGVRRGCVRLNGALIGIDDEDDATFTVTANDGKTFHFQAQDSTEREKWIRALEDAVLRHNQSRRIDSHIFRRIRKTGYNDLQEFDRKLQEADKYLQLIIQQIALLQESRPESDDLLLKANTMTESVKHAIILLQIAKNASVSSKYPIGEMKVISPTCVPCSEEPDVSPCIIIPDISYSSSEDEDYFDAFDGIVDKVESNDFDYDSLYANDLIGDDNLDMKSHGSVITHLLSQVRIGMDLTKIVLPTFILERRSLLEMYSDFFAHPDFFVSIPDGKSPEERIIGTLKWYLSSFHAGRRSPVAKKPYNPIIGEVFYCHWSLGKDSEEIINDSHELLSWCKTNDLVFVAEQVSHHPPISAFYAEHTKKRISVNAHIYTKSSFLGMSIAVHNVGQGIVKLLDHGEEYILTFPTGYGRSILTVPWIELGGKVTIDCPQTQYTATIDFKCKQFFSSETNKIVAEVFAPNSKKPLLKVEGEWNGKMMGKWASGKNEIFVDVSQIPIIPKQIQKIREQQDNESRFLWKDVTYNLTIGKIEAATTAKFALEQKQRSEALERKERNEPWTPMHFHSIGDAWTFRSSLESRFS